jgi:hypothetical protein
MGSPSTLAEGEQGRAGFDDEAEYRSIIFRKNLQNFTRSAVANYKPNHLWWRTA